MCWGKNKMNPKSFFELFSKDEKNQKAFSILLKVIIVCIFLSILLLTIILYSSSLNKNDENNINNKVSEVAKDNQKVIIAKNYDNDKLAKEYRDGLNKSLEDFNGNYEVLKNNIVNLSVPQEYQNLQLNLVVALDTVIYESDKLLAKNSLELIEAQNDWIKKGIDKVINSLQ